MSSLTPSLTDRTVKDTARMSALTHQRQEAIDQLKKIGAALPTATTLIDMKTNNVFAEPGT